MTRERVIYFGAAEHGSNVGSGVSSHMWQDGDGEGAVSNLGWGEGDDCFISCIAGSGSGAGSYLYGCRPHSDVTGNAGLNLATVFRILRPLRF